MKCRKDEREEDSSFFIRENKNYTRIKKHTHKRSYMRKREQRPTKQLRKGVSTCVCVGVIGWVDQSVDAAVCVGAHTRRFYGSRDIYKGEILYGMLLDKISEKTNN